MEYKKVPVRKQPENKIVKEVREKLQAEGWLVEKTHGNQYQAGLPDLFCFHPTHGMRWVELKTPKGRLTHAQGVKFKYWETFKCPIWILIDASEYNLLFEPANWRRYAHKIAKPKRNFI